MKLKRFVAILAVLCVLSSGILTPKPARAVDTVWLVLGSIGAYLVFVGVAAYLVYGRNSEPHLLVDGSVPDLAQDRNPGGVRPGYHCPQAGANLTLACW